MEGVPEKQIFVRSQSSRPSEMEWGRFIALALIAYYFVLLLPTPRRRGPPNQSVCWGHPNQSVLGPPNQSVPGPSNQSLPTGPQIRVCLGAPEGVNPPLHLPTPVSASLKTQVA